MPDLSPAAFQILVALAQGPCHGYAVMRDAGLNPGTLYTTIRKLLDEGLIRETDAPPEESDERRRYYALTAEGRETAQAELARLRALISRASAKLKLQGS